jgi:hypothetical protein
MCRAIISLSNLSTTSLILWPGGSLEFIGDVPIGDKLLPAEHIRFYRLARPPKDLRPAK